MGNQVLGFAQILADDQGHLEVLVTNIARKITVFDHVSWIE
jgi:hypothetical protein